MEFVGAYDAHGARVAVWASPPLDAELRLALGDLETGAVNTATAKPTDEFDHRVDVERDDDNHELWSVRCDGTERFGHTNAAVALYHALIELNQIAAARAATAGFAVLHGGAAVLDGRAVAVVGHSHAGKSTLTTALTRAGWGFVADEVVAVDADGVAHPFHRPIGLRRGGVELLGVAIPDGPFDTVYPYRVGVHGELTDAAPLAAIVVLRRRTATAGDDAGIDEATTPAASEAPSVHRLSAGRALYELANQTLGAASLESAMFSRLDALVRHVPVVEVHYVDAPSAIHAIEAVVRGTHA